MGRGVRGGRRLVRRAGNSEQVLEDRGGLPGKFDGEVARDRSVRQNDLARRLCADMDARIGDSRRIEVVLHLPGFAVSPRAAGPGGEREALRHDVLLGRAARIDRQARRAPRHRQPDISALGGEVGAAYHAAKHNAARAGVHLEVCTVGKVNNQADGLRVGRAAVDEREFAAHLFRDLRIAPAHLAFRAALAHAHLLDVGHPGEHATGGVVHTDSVGGDGGRQGRGREGEPADSCDTCHGAKRVLRYCPMICGQSRPGGGDRRRIGSRPRGRWCYP